MEELSFVWARFIWGRFHFSNFFWKSVFWWKFEKKRGIPGVYKNYAKALNYLQQSVNNENLEAYKLFSEMHTKVQIPQFFFSKYDVESFKKHKGRSCWERFAKSFRLLEKRFKFCNSFFQNIMLKFRQISKKRCR